MEGQLENVLQDLKLTVDAEEVEAEPVVEDDATAVDAGEFAGGTDLKLILW